MNNNSDHPNIIYTKEESSTLVLNEVNSIIILSNVLKLLKWNKQKSKK